MLHTLTLLDGAIGTSLWEKAEDKVPVWRYNIENPAIVTNIRPILYMRLSPTVSGWQRRRQRGLTLRLRSPSDRCPCFWSPTEI